MISNLIVLETTIETTKESEKVLKDQTIQQLQEIPIKRREKKTKLTSFSNL